MSDLKTETIHGVKWTAINSFATTGFNFLLGIVLARLLTPNDYGTVGMMAIFFALASILIDSGLGAALIRKKDLTSEDTSTVFFFNIIVSILCCVLLCYFSTEIAVFLNVPVIEDMIKVPALSLVIGSLGSIHWTLMTRDVDFKTPALVRFPISVVTGIFGIVLAYIGYGPWALIWSSFVNTCIISIIVWFISPWRPRLVFSITSFKEFFAFSGNLVINSILDKFTEKGIGMLIGKYYQADQLGYYSKGESVAQLPSTYLFTMVGSVTFPVLSKIQDDDEHLRSVYSRFMRMISLITFFGMFLLIAMSRPLVIFLFTEKWIPAIIYLQLFSLQFMFYHVHALNWNYLLVKGRSDWAFKKELINKTVRFALVLAALPLGPIQMCIALVLGSIWDVFVNTIVCGKLFGYGLKEQASDFLPYMLLSAVCCIPAFMISYIDILPIIAIVACIMSSSILYFGVLWITHNQDFCEFLKLLPFKRTQQ